MKDLSTSLKITTSLGLVAALIAIFVFITGKNLPDVLESGSSIKPEASFPDEKKKQEKPDSPSESLKPKKGSDPKTEMVDEIEVVIYFPASVDPASLTINGNTPHVVERGHVFMKVKLPKGKHVFSFTSGLPCEKSFLINENNRKVYPCQ